jgi:hypothetical protein
VVCGLAIALWLRSYWWDESFNWRYSTTENIHLGSDAGVLFLGKGTLSPWRAPWPTYSRDEAGVYANKHELIRMPTLLLDATTLQVGIPYWLLLSLTTAMAVLPWAPWAKRFSLRTLLIVTALIAVILGITVETTR